MSLTQLLFALIIVGGIVAVTAIRNSGRLHHRTRSELHDLEQEVGGRMKRLEELEKRVAVLEKIVTDKRYDLDEQLRNLDETG